MSALRREKQGLIDYGRKIHFRFDGQAYGGYAGDSVASALLAAGVKIFGRSFKYHRPRGVWGSWSDDPNAIVDIKLAGNTFANCQATTTMVSEGMDISSTNAWPNAARDVKSILDLANRFLPVGFYYKTFMWPDWHLFEPLIRKMAGIGQLGDDVVDDYNAAILHESCEILVIGGGVSGLVAARTAAKRGHSVLLIDDHPDFGGRFAGQSSLIQGVPADNWIQQQLDAIRSAGGRVLARTTAIGIYDHRFLSLVEDRGVARAPIVRKVRPDRVIVATGALDRPVTFSNNDRPGVMSLDGGLDFYHRYGVLAGQHISILSNRPDAEDQAQILTNAGAQVDLFDATKATAEAVGRRGVEALKFDVKKHGCDLILASSGLTPLVHLWRHAGGKLDWDEARQAFVPGKGPDWMHVIGAANGTFDLPHSLEEARAAARGENGAARDIYALPPLWPDTEAEGRQWLDFQHDVTVKDVALASRENMVSVEHLKRYTTLGMAGDQGKSSNMAALATMADLQQKAIPEVGTTTFRPPFVPIPLEAYSGARKNTQIAPLKRLALETEHRALNAAMGEYGGWLRPAWYGSTDEEQESVRRECQIARQAAAIMDASPLGKIEVMGPDARAFVNFIYYNNMATLKPGRIRYGFMLTEAGLIFDDGVLACINDNHFIISCSSSHVEHVVGHLENWRHDSFDPSRVHIHDATQTWSTITISGPKARDIVHQLDLAIDLTDFPHMSLQNGTFEGQSARIARVSFTGDVSFEVSVPNNLAAGLWQRTLEVGAEFGAGPVGTEALMTLRAEKGYILIGKDTDGETMPHDLGFGAPRLKKKTAYVGDRSLHSANANRSDRKELVGLSVEAGEAMLPIGAHLVTDRDGEKVSLGYVTSSYDSPTLDRPIALALMAHGFEQQGQVVTVWHMGASQKAQVVSPCVYDQEGEYLNA